MNKVKVDSEKNSFENEAATFFLFLKDLLEELDTKSKQKIYHTQNQGKHLPIRKRKITHNNAIFLKGNQVSKND